MNSRSMPARAPLAVLFASFTLAAACGSPPPAEALRDDGPTASDQAALSMTDILTQPIDFRTSWQRTCEPDDRSSYPSSYWVATADGKCTKRRRAGGTGEWRASSDSSKARCHYVWFNDDTSRLPLGFYQDASALESAAKVVDHEPDIVAGCAPAISYSLSFLIPDARMIPPCPDCCPECGLIRGGELYAHVPASFVGKRVAAKKRGDGSVGFEFTPTSTVTLVGGISGRLGHSGTVDLQLR